MTVRPLPGASAKQLIDAIQEVEQGLSGAVNSGGKGQDLLAAYDIWAWTALQRLRSLVGPDDVEVLVTSKRYWTLQAIDVSGRSPDSLNRAVRIEMDEREQVLAETRKKLEEEVRRWSSFPGVLVVADTNVYIHHPCLFDALPWRETVSSRMAGVRLVVPLQVVDELDRLKRTPGNQKIDGTSETVRSRARRTLRLLDDLFLEPSGARQIQPREEFLGAVTIELLMDEPGHLRAPTADQEIIEQAVAVQAISGRDVKLITNDTGMRMRARTSGLEVLAPAEAPATSDT